MIESADLRSIGKIDVLPTERQPLKFSYSGGANVGALSGLGPGAALGSAAGSAASWQRKFEQAFRGHKPDFFSALDAAIVKVLRARGYDAAMATPGRTADARFSVTFTQIGVGFAQSFDGKAIVPHASMAIRVTRASDDRALAVNGLLFGGGGWGTVPKLEAPPHLRIKSIEEFFANPAKSAQMLIAAADVIAPHITRVLPPRGVAATARR